MTISKSEWKDLDEQGQQEFAEKIFADARKNGFPYYNLTAEERDSEFEKLQNYVDKNLDGLIEDGKVKQTMHGLALAWSYMHHSWSVKVGNMKTPMEVFESDELLMKAIRRRMVRGDYFSDSGMRKGLRTYSGVQSVSNFRPTAAAAIYAKYAGENATVWDMSCGYGGRLLGAMVSPNVVRYIGTDPATETMQGLVGIQKDFGLRGRTFIDLFKQGSEIDVPMEDESVDFCFTSPPYFDTEKYSDDEAQSYKKFDSVELWNEGFLRETIRNCMRVLKSGKYMVLNVADVKTHKSLVADTIRIAREEGFEFEEELKLLLSSMIKGGYKYEPVLVFKKP